MHSDLRHCHFICVLSQLELVSRSVSFSTPTSCPRPDRVRSHSKRPHVAPPILCPRPPPQKPSAPRHQSSTSGSTPRHALPRRLNPPPPRPNRASQQSTLRSAAVSSLTSACFDAFGVVNLSEFTLGMPGISFSWLQDGDKPDASEPANQEPDAPSPDPHSSSRMKSVSLT